MNCSRLLTHDYGIRSYPTRVPELPDIRLYLDLLRPRLTGATLRKASIHGVSLLRTFDPQPEAAHGSRITKLSRLGKRVVLTFDSDIHFIIHLMIAGRFRWADAVHESSSRATTLLPCKVVSPDPKRPPEHDAVSRTSQHRGTPQSRGTPLRPTPSKIDQATFTFDTGTLTLTEASTNKRAFLHIVRGPPECLAPFNPGGLDLFSCSGTDFAARLRSENRTLKRALTDPRLIDGVGNAYSDEILHAARMSPMKRTASMSESELATLLHAARETLDHWTRTLRADFGLNQDGTQRTPEDRGKFPGPGQITAFRPAFAVHGKHDQPCPVCGTKVQRILYAENECNYCPRCQTEGKLLADRAMSRLLKSDWPRTIEELEGQG